MNQLSTAARLFSRIWTHPTYGPVARRVVRDALTIFVRHVRNKTAANRIRTIH